MEARLKNFTNADLPKSDDPDDRDEPEVPKVTKNNAKQQSPLTRS